MQRKGIGCRQDMLVKLQTQLAQFGCQLPETLLIRIGESRSTPHKTFVTLLQQTTLFGSQGQIGPFLVHFADPLEKCWIETHVITEGCQQRRNLQGYALHFIVRTSLIEIKKQIAQIIEPSAAELQGFDGIGKGRFVRVGHYGLHLGTSLLQRLLKSRHIIFVTETIKSWGLMGPRPRLKQRIVRTGCWVWHINRGCTGRLCSVQ